jgi:translation initiation factor 2 subunit 1
MLYKKQGFPEEGECVFATVTKIHYHSVFVNLDEYNNKSGMIHISEVSPGRIRNISDYVKEGKVVVCKVLKINKDRGHIDLSLRRVNEAQRRAKAEERKHQTISEAILQSYAKLNKVDIHKVYDDVTKVLLKDYVTLYAAFEDVVENDATLSALSKEYAEGLIPLIKERIKPQEVSIEAVLTIKSYDANGSEDINTLMKDMLATSDILKIQFLGSGRFKFYIAAENYDIAEDAYGKATEVLDGFVKGKKVEHNLARV